MSQTSSRPLQPLEAPNLADAVRVHAEQRPSVTALIEYNGERRELSWAELHAAIDVAGRGLTALGAVAGQRVMFEAANTIDAVVTWFAALRTGVIAIPINPSAPTEEIRRIAAHSGAVLFVGDCDSELPGVHVLTASELPAHAGAMPIASPRDPEALAALIYTAGTSGEPKAVMLTHRALLAHCEGSWRHGIADPDAITLCCLPLSHVFGLNAVLGATVYAGATLVLAAGLSDELPEVLIHERVTHLPLTPSALYRLSLHPRIAEACATLEQVTSGAAPLPAVLAEQWRRLTGLDVHQGYGLTEAGPGVATTVGQTCRGSNHVGRALPGVEIRIGDGSQPTEPAEVWIRGRNLFWGYWPDGADGPDAEGWFATGDIGYLDDQDLFLVDRVREIIIVSGFNVYPTEVEQVLQEHPDVESAAVVGQADERTGERVVAFVTGDKVNVSAVLSHASSRLARYKMPVEIMVIKAMPRSATGKIRKTLLRDMLDMTDEEDL